eukprot:scaffold1880_cov128-Skeletonema_menzelii.AAC.4
MAQLMFGSGKVISLLNVRRWHHRRESLIMACERSRPRPNVRPPATQISDLSLSNDQATYEPRSCK